LPRRGSAQGFYRWARRLARMKDFQKIGDELKAAMKVRDEDRVRVLRALKTAIRNKEVELIRPLEEKEYIQVVKTLIKQRNEAIEQFEKGGRSDLAEIEKRELAILNEYLPKMLSEEEILAIVRRVISESGASGARDVGRVMKMVMAEVGAMADGRLVNSIVVRELGQVGK